MSDTPNPLIAFAQECWAPEYVLVSRDDLAAVLHRGPIGDGMVDYYAALARLEAALGANS